MVTIDNSFIRGGGAKGYPRGMNTFYESLLDVVPDPAAPLAQYLQPGVYYPSEMFTVVSTPQYLSFAPFDAEITAIAFAVARAITGGPSDVDFTIDGTPFHTLSTGAGTLGLTVSFVLPTPQPLDAGELLAAESDGSPTGNSAITVFATVRSRES